MRLSLYSNWILSPSCSSIFYLILIHPHQMKKMNSSQTFSAIKFSQKNVELHNPIFIARQYGYQHLTISTIDSSSMLPLSNPSMIWHIFFRKTKKRRDFIFPSPFKVASILLHILSIGGLHTIIPNIIGFWLVRILSLLTLLLLLFRKVWLRLRPKVLYVRNSTIWKIFRI